MVVKTGQSTPLQSVALERFCHVFYDNACFYTASVNPGAVFFEIYFSERILILPSSLMSVVNPSSS